ncbi:hypothetical protein QTP70_012564 [Hemibagrus guttatus]|uniref:Tc1-like transposase DDE domain-containing protein n=1 Tax=Hemibagrus guttatus TaxID=175788 RepID=A0AAE0QBE0_9TELE|nr:hypothetical protein QTP70_012564 [Hemibagrus guttatus]
MGKCKDLSEFDKGQIVMARRLDQNISKTAALVVCSRSAVVNIYQKWYKEGTVGHGWPRLIDARGERRLARVVRSNRRATVAQIAEEVNSGSARKLKRTWVLQQDNDPKHTSKSTSEWLKKNKMKALEWPSQSPDLNPIEMLWHDLKKVVHARKPSNVAELQQFCKDEWAKIPPQRCNRLIASYGKRLIAVVAAKGGPTSY